MGHLHRVGGETRRDLIGRALASSVALSLLFIVVYSGCNWISTQRSDVGQWSFEWEQAIPFIPLTIIPYMSIDLFFAAAPFLCSSRTELATFNRRIFFTILTAGFFFLVMPLQLVLHRPHVEGWLGLIFNPFVEMDKPFNQFPSLHIALRTILADTYAKHTRGWIKWSSHIWFSLIGFSTLFTHQHHSVDLVGGFLVAAFAFHLFRESTATNSDEVVHRNHSTNPVVGRRYALAAFALTAVGFWQMPWGSLLFWPAGSLACIAVAYLRDGDFAFQKRHGRLALGTQVVHLWARLGHWLSLQYYKRQCEAWNEVVPGLWIGRQLTEREAAGAVGRGVTAVVDLTAEFQEPTPFQKLPYLSLPVLDLTAPTITQLQQAITFIDNHRRTGTVYVHCKIGYSRSAAVIASYLLFREGVQSVEEAIAKLRTVRPAIVVRPEIQTLLENYFATLSPTRTTQTPNT